MAPIMAVRIIGVTKLRIAPTMLHISEKQTQVSVSVSINHYVISISC
jgi:hypothetical protein